MYSKYEVNAQGDGFHAKLFVGENGEGILEADASNMDDCLRELAVQLAKHDIAGYWSTPAPEASANG